MKEIKKKMAKLIIPAGIRSQIKADQEIELDANNLKEALLQACKKCPELQQYIFDADNKVRRFINIFVDNEDYRFLDGLETKLVETSEINLVMAVAGG